MDVGVRSEGAVLSELVKRGYRVLVPFSYNQRYDLVIDLGTRFVRAQCKTGRLHTGAVVFNKISTRCSMTSVHRRTYDEDIDMFLVYCPQVDNVFVVSIEEANAGLSMLRIEPPGNAQRRRINWACDYVLGMGQRALTALPPAAPHP